MVFMKKIWAFIVFCLIVLTAPSAFGSEIHGKSTHYGYDIVLVLLFATGCALYVYYIYIHFEDIERISKALEPKRLRKKMGKRPN